MPAADDRASGAGPAPHRLFVALEVPEGPRRLLDEALGPWRELLPAVRWVPRENWHVTLAFLGAVAPGRVAGLRARLEDVATRVVPFATGVTGLGSFPSTGRARVLWAGLDDRDGHMGTLARGLATALEEAPGSSARRYAAHLTVARSDPPLRLPAAFAETAIEPESFAVGEMVLYRSHLGGPAPSYEALRRFPFGPSPG